jgi:hypothetical protein
VDLEELSADEVATNVLLGVVRLEQKR